MIAVLNPDRVEEDLAAGEIACPRCGVELHAWSWARRRRIRQADGSTTLVRPRRARCPNCAATHVLLAADCLPRRADSVQVIGAALLARASGRSHRQIAADLDRQPSTVRGWLRGLHGRHLTWLRRQGVDHAHRHDPQALSDTPVHANDLADALEALGTAARAAAQRFRLDRTRAWPLVTIFTHGRLLGGPTQHDQQGW